MARDLTRNQFGEPIQSHKKRRRYIITNAKSAGKPLVQTLAIDTKSSKLEIMLDVDSEREALELRKRRAYAEALRLLEGRDADEMSIG